MSDHYAGCEWVNVSLVLAYPGSPVKRVLNSCSLISNVCVCVCVCVCVRACVRACVSGAHVEHHFDYIKIHGIHCIQQN